ncbi:MAG: NAD(+)/NADH kinase [Candidatus Marinimicrobia bacterium]|nr:NAD(+)/NADH kinase [Candidatus Neomarinimicrobiota bacterium]
MKYGIIANTNKKELFDILQGLISWLEKNDNSVVVEKDVYDAATDLLKNIEYAEKDKISSLCDMVLALGGDGTIIRAARVVGNSGVPIAGINLGGLGFLAEVAVEEIYERLQLIQDGEYLVEERMVLKAKLESAPEVSYRALNDIVIERGSSTRMVSISVTVDDKFFNRYSADGIIIATPTGSTAYSLSAGGPIIVPPHEAIIVTPLSPHSLSLRAVVIKPDSKIKINIENASGKMLLSIDGQTSVKIKNGQNISVERAKNNIRLVKWKDGSYFDTLRTKLNWGVGGRS